MAVAAVLFAVPCFAQRTIDTFGAVRTVVLSPAQNLVVGVAAVTNGPIDMKLFEGVAKVDIFSMTNTGNTGGTLTCTLYTSPDQTNLTALSNFALISGTTAVNYTNLYYGGTSLWTTNNYLLPGTITTPTASSAGFATKYLASLPYTNSGAITVTSKGYVEVGYNVADANRYLYAVWTPGGTFTNFTTGAVLTAPMVVTQP